MNEASSVPLLALPIGVSPPWKGLWASPKTPTPGSKEAARRKAEDAGEEKCVESTFTVGAKFFDEVLDCSENRDPLKILEKINERITDKIEEKVLMSPFTNLLKKVAGLKFVEAEFDVDCKKKGSFMLYLRTNYGVWWDPIRVTIEQEGWALRLILETEAATDTWAISKRFQKYLIDEYAAGGILLPHKSIRDMKRQVRQN